MKNQIQWTTRLPEGIKREARVTVTRQHIQWQFKRSDEERWDYDSTPSIEDWDYLEDFLRRRAQRGRGGEMALFVHKLRLESGM